MARPTKETKPPTDTYRCKQCKNNHTYNLKRICTKCLNRNAKEERLKNSGR